MGWHQWAVLVWMVASFLIAVVNHGQPMGKYSWIDAGVKMLGLYFLLESGGFF